MQHTQLCGSLGRVGYLVTSGEALDAALWPLSMMPALRELLLEVAGFLVGAEHLKVRRGGEEGAPWSTSK
jgi:hypothetical protein